MLLMQVLSLEQQLSVVIGNTSSQHADLPVPVTPPRPLTSVSQVNGLSDLSSESDHSSPENNTPGEMMMMMILLLLSSGVNSPGKLHFASLMLWSFLAAEKFQLYRPIHTDTNYWCKLFALRHNVL